MYKSMTLLCALALFLCLPACSNATNAKSSDQPTVSGSQQKDMTTCFNGSATRGIPAAQWQAACDRGYKFALNSADKEPWKDEMQVTGSVLELWDATALMELHAKAKAAPLATEARNRLILVAATGSTPQVRVRAQTMINCIVYREPKCLAAWAQAQKTGYSRPMSTAP